MLCRRADMGIREDIIGHRSGTGRICGIGSDHDEKVRKGDVQCLRRGMARMRVTDWRVSRGGVAF